MTERGPAGRRLQLQWLEREREVCLRISGWNEAELRALGTLSAAELGRRLSVLPTALLPASNETAGLQPIAGRFEVQADAVCFVPRFAFMPGTGYSLLVTRPATASQTKSNEVWSIERPARAAHLTTRVSAFYPTADVVPLNLLKIYIRFSAPMSEGRALQAVRVHQADTGAPLNDVFLPMEPELWDPGRRRLTMLLDPGRIKRGLAPHEEAGYPLAEGVPIVISVDTSFRDATGQTLTEGWEQRYDVGPAARARVDPSTWRYEAPSAGSKRGLTVSFGRPLDHGLLQHSLTVRDASGAAVSGRGYGGPGEWCWWFEPEAPWRAGSYALAVDPRLEDLAGNSLMRVFDRDLMRDEDTPADGRPVLVPFAAE